MKLQGHAVKYGDNISTDLIIAGKHTKTLNVRDLADHAMEDLDPAFGRRISGGGILAAGSYFGCGSSREQAPVALKEAGVLFIAAKTFSRIFYRNAVNIGLPVVECDTDAISDDDILEYDVGAEVLRNITQKKELAVTPLPEIMVEILKEGGVVPYIRKYGGF
ncbi:MAG: 3-isopropylmalate dehydratase [Synergistaceae bacterium]|jgi:3-isopropylmalate/(R)-2-methylmalate dehydratase small subunit|nr:3-isopropylmalate dehydratase [Synergistaceae bacterium]